jgi:hypothetical protein
METVTSKSEFIHSKMDYIDACKRNAIQKRELESKLIYDQSRIIPFQHKGSEVKAYIADLPSRMDDQLIIMDWIHDLRTKGITPENETLMMEVSLHDAFVTMYTLNNLRKCKIPNFLYYHGVLSIGKRMYNCLSEYTFNTDFQRWKSFYEICIREEFKVVLSYYLSVLFAIYEANHEYEYTHYNLIPENILMKPMNEKHFNVQYDFRGSRLSIENYGFVPLIINHSTSYIRFKIDDSLRSFGYNDVNKIPAENRGIYCDRGFPITDAYRLIVSILKITKEQNTDVYEKFLPLYSFFEKYKSLNLNEANPFLSYNRETAEIRIGDFINFILDKYPAIISKNSSNNILCCSGTHLHVKDSSFVYHVPRNFVQLFDFIEWNQIFGNQEVYEQTMNVFNSYYFKDAFNTEISKLDDLTERLETHEPIYQIPETFQILKNKRYLDLLISNINSMIEYYNAWESVEFNTKILKKLTEEASELEDILEKYSSLVENNKKYYESLIESLQKIKYMFLEDQNIPRDVVLRQLLFFETLQG